MKKSIINILLVASILIAPSCTTTYFYSTLNVEEPNVEKVDNGDFLFENDSLWIAHCFKGEDAPIQITIFNKLDIPLYVDWNSSALILDNVAYSYSKSVITTESTVYQNGAYHTTAVMSNKVEIPQYVRIIPPKTMITHHTLRLSAKFDKISKKEYTSAKLGDKDNQMEEIKRINYNHDNSPLRFGSYVTVYAKPEKPQAYEFNFYVTNLIKTKVKPQDLPADMAERGDFFYQCKRPDNTGWYILADVGVIAGAAAVGVSVLGNQE